ncbi:hypothetical protein Tco_1173143 [Tanacetum coccineum]
MSSMGELTFFLGLQVQQKKKGIFISQDKYVHEILRKFNYTDVKSASTPTDLEKPLVQDGDAADVDEHLYRSMIGSLMYLTASRPDIMFAVCACARFQVSPKTSHLLAVKRIFRYLKGKPSLGLWYPKDSPLELVAYTDSDYAGATQDRKSTTGGCQFLGSRLISWQCKKQTVVATSTTEAEYVAAANCCGQVLWIQNQLLDYGYNFMNTVIYIDNTSTICIIENPVQHSKTKHIEIRHHFIRDCNAKKLIQMAKIDTEHNVADLLTKGFDAGRFQYLVSKHHFPTPHPLHVVHSHGSDEGSLKLNELMNLVTKLSDRIGVLEDDLKKTKKTYSSAYTNLILRVKKLESQLKTGKARRKSRIVLSDDEVIEDDSSKHGRKLSDAEVQEKANQEGSEKASDEVSTAGAKKGTASEEDLIVSSAVLSFAEAIRLEEQMNKEQRVRLQEMKRLRQWDEEERQRAMDEAKFSKQIYWNGPSVIRPIFEKVWDFNQNIEPMDVEHGSKKKKSPKKMKAAEKLEEEDVATQKEMQEVSKETGAKWKENLFLEKIFIKFSEEMAVPRTTCLLSEMLEDFDRQDVEELYRLVKEKYSASRLEGFDLMLWGDLYTYWKLEVDHESSQAFELLRFIRSQVQKVEEMFERIISKRRRLKDLIQKKLGDLKEITRDISYTADGQSANWEISMHGDYMGMLDENTITTVKTIRSRRLWDQHKLRLYYCRSVLLPLAAGALLQ